VNTFGTISGVTLLEYPPAGIREILIRSFVVLLSPSDEYQ